MLTLRRCSLQVEEGSAIRRPDGNEGRPDYSSQVQELQSHRQEGPQPLWRRTVKPLQLAHGPTRDSIQVCELRPPHLGRGRLHGQIMPQVRLPHLRQAPQGRDGKNPEGRVTIAEFKSRHFALPSWRVGLKRKGPGPLRNSRFPKDPSRHLGQPAYPQIHLIC